MPSLWSDVSVLLNWPSFIPGRFSTGAMRQDGFAQSPQYASAIAGYEKRRPDAGPPLKSLS